MIEITPVPGEHAVVLLAREGGKDAGLAEMERADEKFVLTALSYQDELAGELLIRACASYAERRGAGIISARMPVSPLMTKAGFDGDELDVTRVIRYHHH